MYSVSPIFKLANSFNDKYYDNEVGFPNTIVRKDLILRRNEEERKNYRVLDTTPNLRTLFAL